MSDYTPKKLDLNKIFNLLGQPERLKIVLAIGKEHACVCHLESVLGMRQAYISQQLMLLRQSGLVVTERSGRHIFYSLVDPRWLDLIDRAAQLADTSLPSFTLPEIDNCVYLTCKKTKQQEKKR